MQEAAVVKREEMEKERRDERCDGGAEGRGSSNHISVCSGADARLHPAGGCCNWRRRALTGRAVMLTPRAFLNPHRCLTGS